ncbi:MAG: Hsp20/alpha crystallin family protein [Saprospiraceae bacterium]|nr:Hsp20/alpha crystallin family protein [Saprospiraceae bacterium]
MCYKAAHHSHWKKHHHHARRRHHRRMARWAYPPASIEELDDRYEILIYAAGYEKSDFQVGLEDDHLLIKVKKETADEIVEDRRVRGYTPGSFERHFTLNPKIDRGGISANYEEGILKVVLPKKEGSETFRQDIEIV